MSQIAHIHVDALEEAEWRDTELARGEEEEISHEDLIATVRGALKCE
jgi:hypothetical protein